MSFVSHNGRIINERTPLLTADNSCFKWGLGLFETIKILDGKIQLEAYHFERLQLGLDKLNIRYSNTIISEVIENIYQLCSKNDCINRARVRLAVYPNKDGWAETIIQAFALPLKIDAWNEKGWKVDIYKDAVKAVDTLSNLKTSSYLPYTLAAMHARYTGLDECILLNSNGSVCDGSKTNLFIISNGNIYTPALEQGCIAGVMRRYIIETLSRNGIKVLEQALPVDLLVEADECFVTNAIIGIKWVEAFGEKKYSNKKAYDLYELLHNN